MWQVFAGSGCHIDARIAAERALLEAVQSRGSVISGGRDDIPEWTFRQRGASACRVRAPSSRSEPLPAPGGSPRNLREILAELVAAVHQRTRRPVVAVDLTPARDAWPAVVQVFAPGLADTQQHPGLQ